MFSHWTNCSGKSPQICLDRDNKLGQINLCKTVCIFGQNKNKNNNTNQSLCTQQPVGKHEGDSERRPDSPPRAVGHMPRPGNIRSPIKGAIQGIWMAINTIRYPFKWHSVEHMAPQVPASFWATEPLGHEGGLNPPARMQPKNTFFKRAVGDGKYHTRKSLETAAEIAGGGSEVGFPQGLQNSPTL